MSLEHELGYCKKGHGPLVNRFGNQDGDAARFYAECPECGYRQGYNEGLDFLPLLINKLTRLERIYIRDE
jgi:hypothetical protein